MPKSSIDNIQPKALSIEQVIVQTGFGRTTIYAAIKTRGLKARKLGRRTVVLSDDLNRWLTSLPLLAAA